MIGLSTFLGSVRVSLDVPQLEGASCCSMQPLHGARIRAEPGFATGFQRQDGVAYAFSRGARTSLRQASDLDLHLSRRARGARMEGALGGELGATRLQPPTSTLSARFVTITYRSPNAGTICSTPGASRSAGAQIAYVFDSSDGTL
jgi:hypothetical protein